MYYLTLLLRLVKLVFAEKLILFAKLNNFSLKLGSVCKHTCDRVYLF
jgi:hypothetical protein